METIDNKRKSVSEIVQLIASSYTSNTRSKYNNRCLYNGLNGEHCAFAMMVKEPTELKKYEGKRADVVLNSLGMNVVKNEFFGHNKMFYVAIQALHDDDDNWDEKGLSSIGREVANTIIKEFK